MIGRPTSEEGQPGIVLDFNEKEQVVGIEIVREVQESQASFAAGVCEPASVEEIMKEIAS